MTVFVGYFENGGQLEIRTLGRLLYTRVPGRSMIKDTILQEDRSYRTLKSLLSLSEIFVLASF